jgi:hypothetical protein
MKRCQEVFRGARLSVFLQDRFALPGILLRDNVRAVAL